MSHVKFLDKLKQMVAKGSNSVFPIMLLEIRFNPTGLCGWLLVWSVPLYNGDVAIRPCVC